MSGGYAPVRLLAVAVVLLAGGVSALPSADAACLPPIMLWAWERPDDLTGVDPAVAGVAYLAKTILVSGREVVVRPRRQPLRTSAGAVRIPVVRIEAAALARPRQAAAVLDEGLGQQLAAEIVPLARVGTPALQIDFDAAQSQRAFYHELLSLLRARLPPETRLSITALASWTLFDDWLTGLPIDEAVPMLFRMGADAAAVRRHLRAGGVVRPAVARASLGIATDEPIAGLPGGRRVWIFNNGPWTPSQARTAIGEVGAWQGRFECG